MTLLIQKFSQRCQVEKTQMKCNEPLVGDQQPHYFNHHINETAVAVILFNFSSVFKILRTEDAHIKLLYSTFGKYYMYSCNTLKAALRDNSVRLLVGTCTSSTLTAVYVTILQCFDTLESLQVLSKSMSLVAPLCSSFTVTVANPTSFKGFSPSEWSTGLGWDIHIQKQRIANQDHSSYVKGAHLTLHDKLWNILFFMLTLH